MCLYVCVCVCVCVCIVRSHIILVQRPYKTQKPSLGTNVKRNRPQTCPVEFEETLDRLEHEVIRHVAS